MRLWRLVSFALVLPALSAQQEDRISLDVRRVVLYASIAGENKAELTKENFEVLEDKKPQPILHFSREEAPVAIGLLIDNSQSIAPFRNDVVAAARAFVRARNPHDEIFVIHFNNDIRFALPQGTLFTADQAVLDRALESMGARGRTALYDAVADGLRRLRESKLDKKALVLISDGGDNESVRTREDVVKAAGVSGAIFYGIGIYDPEDRDANPGVLRRLAKDTGGVAYFPKSVQQVSAACRSINADLRSQYTLVYAPPDRPPDNKFHQVEVRAKDAQGRRLKVRTRTGYYDVQP